MSKNKSQYSQRDSTGNVLVTGQQFGSIDELFFGATSETVRRVSIISNTQPTKQVFPTRTAAPAPTPTYLSTLLTQNPIKPAVMPSIPTNMPTPPAGTPGQQPSSGGGGYAIKEEQVAGSAPNGGSGGGTKDPSKIARRNIIICVSIAAIIIVAWLVYRSTKKEKS